MHTKIVSAFISFLFLINHSSAQNAVQVPNVPQPDNSVVAAAIDSTTNILYIAGQFLNVDTFHRAGIAAIDLNTNKVTTWNPPGNRSAVWDVQIIDSVVYFISDDGNGHNWVTAALKSTGDTLAWPVWPMTTGLLYSLKPLPNGKLAVSGSFSQIGNPIGTNRNNFAVYNRNTQALTSEQIFFNNTVTSLELNGSKLYAGGIFDSVNAAGRYVNSRLASIDFSNFTIDTAIQISIYSSVYGIGQIKKIGTRIYISSDQGGVGIYDAITNLKLGSAQAIGAYGVAGGEDHFFAGGTFTQASEIGHGNSVGTVTRIDLALMDTIEDGGFVECWDAGLSDFLGNGYTSPLVEYNGIVYLGGDITPANLTAYYTNSISTGYVAGSVCKGSQLNIPFTAIGVYNPGNMFKAQLSNATGSFAAPVDIGILNTTQHGNLAVSATIPDTMPNGSNYLIRIISTNPPFVGCLDLITPYISLSNPIIGPDSLIISSDTACGAVSNEFCSAFFYHGTNSGSFTYNWTIPSGWSKIDSVNGQSNTLNSRAIIITTSDSSGFISLNLSNACSTSPTLSKYVTIFLSDATPVIVGPDTVCYLDTVTYSVVSIYGAAGYDWYSDRWPIISGQNTTQVTVICTDTIQTHLYVAAFHTFPGGYTCWGNELEDTFYSRKNIPPATAPQIFGSTHPCQGDTLSYHIAPLANAVSYLWTVPSGWNIIGYNSDTIIKAIAGIASGNVTVQGANSCRFGPTTSLNVTSGAINIPGCSIAVAQNNFCAGTVLTTRYTSTITNGGSSPTFNWYINGLQQTNNHTDSLNYLTQNLNNGDVIYAVMYSNASCLSADSTISNSITMVINPTLHNNLQQHICQGSGYFFNGNIISTAGTYTDTITASTGCDSIVNIILAIDSNPVIVTLPDTAVCRGRPIIITATASGATINWMGGYTNLQSVSINQDQQFVVTATNAITGCVANDTFTITALIPMGLMRNTDTAICAGNQLELNALNGLSFAWSSSISGIISTDSSYLFTANNSQKIFVDIIDSHLCPATDSFNLSILPEIVWPGDANDDSIVNNYDILAIGIAYGATGPSRPDASIIWQAQCDYAWTNSFLGGVNFVQADCNGDGIINDLDTLAVAANYGLIKSARAFSRQGNFTLQVFTDRNTYFIGDTVNGYLLLGDSINPANNIYCIAYTVNAGSAVKPNSFLISQASSWLLSSGNGLEFIKQFGYSDVEMAQTRINHNNTSGFGKIALFTFIVDTGFAGGSGYVITTTNALCLNNQGDTLGVNLLADTITINNIVTGTTAFESGEIKVYPNPTTGYVTVQLFASQRTEITSEVYNDLGQLILSKNTDASTLLDLSPFPSGIYIVKVANRSKTIITKRICLTR